jgi:peptide-methionine (S)-S-oxide reductase
MGRLLGAGSVSMAVAAVLSERAMNRRWIHYPLAAALIGAGAFVLAVPATAGSDARVVPPFVTTKAASEAAPSEVAVLAGGCFWGVQGVFQHVQGVSTAVSGYAGGDKLTAHYAVVGSGLTGHAESVQVTFDPRQISYARILQIFFSVAHDPTQVNRQGPDSGTQYRSAIFPANDEQSLIARAYIAQLTQAHVFDAPVATTVEPGRTFFPAENYHQDYLVHNPMSPYIVVNDLPKIESLRKLFPDLYRATPALVFGAQKANSN